MRHLCHDPVPGAELVRYSHHGRMHAPTSIILLCCLTLGSMATRDNSPPPAQSCTTNEHDLREAARLKDQLQADKGQTNAVATATPFSKRLSSVEICDGAHKYVQLTASLDGTEQVFVVSRKNAAYHRNAAEPFIDKLQKHGYYDIEVAGGGRVAVDSDERTVSIFGFSYGFGKANHELSANVVRQDERYRDFDVSWSDDGY